MEEMMQIACKSEVHLGTHPVGGGNRGHGAIDIDIDIDILDIDILDIDIDTDIDIYIYTISADPGLRQGRGGAWDHRRCGTCFLARLCLSANLGSDSRHSLCFKLSSSRGRPFLQDLRPWQSNPTSP